MPSARINQPLKLSYTRYIITSQHQAYPCMIRTLEPDNLHMLENPKLVYVLPCNPDVNVRWNDGLDTFLAEDLHNRYGVIAIAPSFSHWTWYANHPTDPAIQQETYLLEDVIPFVDDLYPQVSRKRLLMGFSKSGNGSFQLLMRHPDTFHAIAVWDSPLMKESPDQFEMSEIYGTQANFNHYCIPKLLYQHAHWLRQSTRIALLGHGFFGGENPPDWTYQHTEQAHALLSELEIPHIYDNATYREHRWDTGWMEQALEALLHMAT